MRGERKRMKEKLVLLFSDNQAQKILNTAELEAICEYLHSKVEPFMPTAVTKNLLLKLVGESEVVDIESDAIPFNHAFRDEGILNLNNRVTDDHYNQE